jgi:ribosome biogenesis protein BRX1
LVLVLEACFLKNVLLDFQTKWINRQRVLVLCGRGINHRDRHLMKDIKSIMPHHRAESKLERWKTLSVINEMGEMKHCNKAMYFEGRHKQDLFMWISNMPDGPSAKFQVDSKSTMAELKLTGNCLKGARPLLSFDQEFSKLPHLQLLREMLTQTFGVPHHHPKSQPFVDRIYTFTYLDGRIWFRNYQILAEDGALAEIGPRFVLNPVKIFEDSFGGKPLWENSNYVTPAKYRQILKKNAKDRYLNRTDSKARYEATVPTKPFDIDKIGQEVYFGDEEEKAKQLVEAEDEADDDSHDSDVANDNDEEQIKRVKALIAKLKPGKTNKLKEATSVKRKSDAKKRAQKSSGKPLNKKAKLIQNIQKTKKLKKIVK